MVHAQVISPQWFFGVDAAFELLTAVVAILVAITAYKVCKITESRMHRTFAIAFGLLAMGFAARGFADIIIEQLIHFSPQVVHSLPGVPGMSRTSFVFLAGYISHILFVLAAYLLLVIVTYRIKDRALMILLFMLTLPSLLISGSYFLSYYGLSLVLMGAVTYRHYRNCQKRGVSSLVTIAFGFITVAQPNFIMSAMNMFPQAAKDVLYVSGHVIQMIGVMLILIALLKIRKK